MRKLRALVVDDVLDMAQTIANELEGAGFETDVAASGSVALERFARDPVDVVVTDLRMKSVDGLDVLGGIKRADPTGQIRLASGDVVVLGGEARRAYHGVDRIVPGSSRLLAAGGRINLTLRRAAPVVDGPAP